MCKQKGRRISLPHFTLITLPLWPLKFMVSLAAVLHTVLPATQG